MFRRTCFRYLFVITFLITLSACALVKNDPIGTCQTSNGTKALRLTGHRDNKTHSLILFVLNPSISSQTEFVVPAFSNVIPGAQVSWSTYPNAKLDGKITFSDHTATVDLYLQPRPDYRTPLDWNGMYELHGCDQ